MRLRPATAGDAGAVAEIYLAARAAASPSVRWAHDAAEVRDWVAGTLIPSGGVHLAEQDGTIAGYIAVAEGHVEHLYVQPSHWRRGIGAALLDHAKTLSPKAVELWCFQCNLPARAFYERQGFTEVERTDGRENEEREPDILFAWQSQHARELDR